MIFTSTVLECDRCTVNYIPETVTADAAIRALSASLGWTRSEDGKDYCPGCSA